MIQVQSEVGTLRRVLLHRPGPELEQLTPEALESLLFDDIPFLSGAVSEHDCFAQALRDNGVEVVYLADMTAQALRTDSGLPEAFVEEFLDRSGAIARRLRDVLRSFLLGIPDPRELVLKTMAGVRFDEISPHDGSSLAQFLNDTGRFVVNPMPNLYFTRDPFASIGRGAALGSMRFPARRRETLYGKYMLLYHPDYAGQVPFYYDINEPFSLEGGDVLNLSAKVLAVGISQRTAPEAIDRLAHNLLFEQPSEIETVLALYIPGTRAFMHLDTVFTQVDRDKFLVHPEILRSLRLFALTRGGGGRVSIRELDGTLEDNLCRVLGLDACHLILCGGGDSIASRREQWNDGSNSLCIAPGVVVTYDRNYVTNELLQTCGVRVVHIPSAELSRGRGGPRCMSMPLRRDTL